MCIRDSQWAGWTSGKTTGMGTFPGQKTGILRNHSRRKKREIVRTRRDWKDRKIVEITRDWKERGIVETAQDWKNRKVKKTGMFLSAGSRESSLLTFETYLFFIRHQCWWQDICGAYARSCHKSWIPFFSHSFAIASGHREDCTSPICALRRKNIQIRDCPRCV